MAERHVRPDLPAALLLGGAPLADVVLLLGALAPVGLGAPPDLGKAPVLALLARADGLEALGGVAVLLVAHVALEGQGCRKN